MQKLQTVRGTYDILETEMRKFSFIVEKAFYIASLYGFHPIQTPIFEHTDVFSRPLGDMCDVVTKEMYTFEDRANQSLTLRPEGTAGVVRAFIQNGLQQNTPFKAFYSGPMFRYERPQKGRQRQFHQFGVEFLGVKHPNVDVDIISMAVETLKILGVEKDTTLHINTLGDQESRTAYRTALVDYLEKYTSSLSKDSQMRLKHNPLRILDTKNTKDQEILTDVPAIYDYLNVASRQYFETVLEGLDAINIAYTKNPKLVRGFDYYCHTTFECMTDVLGSQGTVIGGGRYDGLCEILGGKPTAAIGYGAGIERLSLMIKDKEVPIDRGVVLVTLSKVAEEKGLQMAKIIRGVGIRCECAYMDSMKKQLKFANAVNAKIALIIGEEEIQKNIITVRNLDSGLQEAIGFDSLVSYLASAMKKQTV